MTDSKGLFPLPQYRKPVKKMSNGRRAIIKELDALQKTVNSNTLLIETLQRNMAATEESHNLHIAALSNFLGHDMKNCIQNMDVILTSYRADEITEGHLESLRVQLDMIREVMGNFAQLVPRRAGRDFQGQQPDWRDGGFDSFDAGGKRGFVHEGIAGRHRFAD